MDSPLPVLGSGPFDLGGLSERRKFNGPRGAVTRRCAAARALFGKLFAVIIAAKKVLIAGAVALFGFVARLFKKKDSAA
jgi:hypothetical protein